MTHALLDEAELRILEAKEAYQRERSVKNQNHWLRCSLEVVELRAKAKMERKAK